MRIVNILFLCFFHQLLYQDDEPRIMYSYFLPKDYPNKNQAQQPAEPAGFGQRGVQVQPTQSVTNENLYVWKLTGFTQCTHSCAGGT